MIVTELNYVKNNKVEVSFDSGDLITTTNELVTANTLYVGRELTDDEYWSLHSDSSLVSAKEAALRVVGQRSISRRDLIRRLVQKKGEDPAAAESAADWLEEKGYLNDSDYACTIARHYAAKGYGPGRIRTELFKRGIDREHWNFAMSDLPEPDEKIDKILYSKLRGNPDPDRAELKRAVDSLARRGFSWNDIKSAVERYKDRIEEAEDVL